MMPVQGKSSAGSVAERLEKAKALCMRRGSRLTPLRKQVLTLLLQAPGSVKAYDLLEVMRQARAGIAPQTVYRALDFLTAQGLIHRLDLVNAWTACKDIGGHHHDLLVVCTECGRVAELNDPVLTRHLNDSAAQAGYKLEGAQTEVRAFCEACRLNPGKTSAHGQEAART